MNDEDNEGNLGKLGQIAQLLCQRIDQLNEAERLLTELGPEERQTIDRLLKERDIDLSDELPGLADGSTFLWFYPSVPRAELPTEGIPFILLTPSQWPGEVAHRCRSKVPEIGIFYDHDLPRATRVRWRRIVDGHLELIDEKHWNDCAVFRDYAQVALADLQREAAANHGEPLTLQRRQLAVERANESLRIEYATRDIPAEIIEGLTRSDGDQEPLDKRDFKILEALGEAPYALLLCDLEAHSGISRRTNGRRVNKMIRMGLITRNGERGPNSITEKGRKWLAAVDSED